MCLIPYFSGLVGLDLAVLLAILMGWDITMTIMGLCVHREELEKFSGLMEIGLLLAVVVFLLYVGKACLWLIEGLNLTLASG